MDDLSDPRLDRVFSEYAERAAAAVPQPDLARVQALAARRRRIAVVATTAAVAAAVAIPAVAQTTDLFAFGPASHGPGGGGLGSPTVSASLSTDPWGSEYSPGPVLTSARPEGIEGTNWYNVTFTMPANETGCAPGRVTFESASAALLGGGLYQINSGYNSSGDPFVGYGDVDGDGKTDAVLVVTCWIPPALHNNPPPLLIALTGERDDVETLGLVFTSRPREPDGEGQEYVMSLAVQPNGDVTFMKRTFEGMSQWGCSYRWDGASFAGECSP